ncbi:MAG: N5-glutamine methyltransferase family protein [Chloroflexota bacterium]|nr:MAG: hypothetical protein DLM70_13785 [Chloroflexota bacterium]
MNPALSATGTVDDALRWGRVRLASSDSPALDSQLLLGHVLGTSRAWLFAHGDDDLHSRQWRAFEGLVGRRAGGEPIAYLRGWVEWHGREYASSPRALVPRPETERLLETAVELCTFIGARTVADIGTGSGVIAAELALALPAARIIAVDRSRKALSVAADNLARVGATARVTLLHGHLLEPIDEPPHAMVANLPYLSLSMMRDLPREVRHEPCCALFGGGETGLELYAELLDQMLRRGWEIPIAAEIDPRQTEAARRLFSSSLPHLTVRVLDDYAHSPRIVMAARGSPGT